MKKRILFLGFLLMVFGLRIDAQTLKNIHRHNQPVLRIPTHLIDKVETTEVNGAQVLQVRQLNGYVSEIPLSQIDSITHSEGEAVDPAQLGSLRYASVIGVVTGPTGAPEMNAIVRSPYGGEETRTDPNGVFFLNNILVYDKLGYITITKPGFHQASRSFLPLETGSNRVNVQLLPMTQSGSFSAASGGTVTSGLLQLTFPANGVTLNGQPYTGIVQVFAAALDPSSTAMFDQMPGELLGGLNDSLQLLRSFGMASIELRDNNMSELKLANGVSATLRFNIPATLQAEAPQIIDWWSFDETLGYWKHEGEAQKSGTQYIGQASHFSWWNCDVPQNFNEIHGSVNSPGGTPVAGAQVNVISPTMGTGITYTNSEGGFTGRLPKNQLLDLNVFLICNTSNDWSLVHSASINSLEQPVVNDIYAELNNRYKITGVLNNCEGQPVSSGYLKIGSQIFFSQNGFFLIQACALGEVVLRAYDSTNPDSIKASDLDTIQVSLEDLSLGEIQICSQYYGIVNDSEGNIYTTVRIGNKIWMAENLRAAKYSNGDIIPQITDNTAWVQTITGAWSNYNNNVANDALYGKLYNWYATVDPRSLCPSGWHVFTDTDLTELTDYLGGFDLAGGKLKTVTGWNTPNAGATNEFGFSGLPGGIRSPGLGLFNVIGEYGYWWSSTEVDSDNAWFCFMVNNNSTLTRQSYLKKAGRAVRCIKDQ